MKLTLIDLLNGSLLKGWIPNSLKEEGAGFSEVLALSTKERQSRTPSDTKSEEFSPPVSKPAVSFWGRYRESNIKSQVMFKLPTGMSPDKEEFATASLLEGTHDKEYVRVKPMASYGLPGLAIVPSQGSEPDELEFSTVENLTERTPLSATRQTAYMAKVESVSIGKVTASTTAIVGRMVPTAMSESHSPVVRPTVAYDVPTPNRSAQKANQTKHADNTQSALPLGQKLTPRQLHASQALRTAESRLTPTTGSEQYAAPKVQFTTPRSKEAHQAPREIVHSTDSARPRGISSQSLAGSSTESLVERVTNVNVGKISTEPYLYRGGRIASLSVQSAPIRKSEVPSKAVSGIENVGDHSIQANQPSGVSEARIVTLGVNVRPANTENNGKVNGTDKHSKPIDKSFSVDVSTFRRSPERSSIGADEDDYAHRPFERDYLPLVPEVSPLPAQKVKQHSATKKVLNANLLPVGDDAATHHTDQKSFNIRTSQIRSSDNLVARKESADPHALPSEKPMITTASNRSEQPLQTRGHSSPISTDIETAKYIPHYSRVPAAKVNPAPTSERRQAVEVLVEKLSSGVERQSMITPKVETESQAIPTDKIIAQKDVIKPELVAPERQCGVKPISLQTPAKETVKHAETAAPTTPEGKDQTQKPQLPASHVVRPPVALDPFAQKIPQAIPIIVAPDSRTLLPLTDNVLVKPLERRESQSGGEHGDREVSRAELRSPSASREVVNDSKQQSGAESQTQNRDRDDKQSGFRTAIENVQPASQMPAPQRTHATGQQGMTESLRVALQQALDMSRKRVVEPNELRLTVPIAELGSMDIDVVREGDKILIRIGADPKALAIMEEQRPQLTHWLRDNGFPVEQLDVTPRFADSSRSDLAGSDHSEGDQESARSGGSGGNGEQNGFGLAGDATSAPRPAFSGARVWTA